MTKTRRFGTLPVSRAQLTMPLHPRALLCPHRVATLMRTGLIGRHVSMPCVKQPTQPHSLRWPMHFERWAPVLRRMWPKRQLLQPHPVAVVVEVNTKVQLKLVPEQAPALVLVLVPELVPELELALVQALVPVSEHSGVLVKVQGQVQVKVQVGRTTETQERRWDVAVMQASRRVAVMCVMLRLVARESRTVWLAPTTCRSTLHER